MELKIKDKDIRNEIVKKIEELSNTNVFRCYQCGKCSAGCPSSPFMDILPNQVMMLLQEGKIEYILGKNTHWICASCFTCSARCPKDIDIAAVMEAIRVVETRNKKDYISIYEIKEEERKGVPPIAFVSAMRKLSS
uniref:Heterodisulfide reductase n=1 Tax=candidate division WOR-3 bacterium TaxID=2052148 RepID=A0A7C4U757_UNCW3